MSETPMELSGNDAFELRNLSLQRLLINALKTVLDEILTRHWINVNQGCVEFTNLPDLSPRSPLYSGVIPVKRIRENKQVRYVSAIALKTSAVLQVPPVEMAQRLSTLLFLPHGREIQTHLQHLFNGNDPSFKVEITEPGWIFFILSDRAVGKWLQQVVEYHSVRAEKAPASPLKTGNNRYNLPSVISFPIQYAHARCWSLLRLLQREHWLPLEQDGFIIPSHSDRPCPLSWCQPDGTLLLQQASERYLLHELIDTVDGLATETLTDKARLSMGQRLSQRFEAFHAHHPLGGRWRETDQAHFLACVGLLMATGVVLRSLLEEELHLPAPTEL